MYYIAYDKDNKSFYATQDIKLGVFVNGKLFDFAEESFAIDFAEEFTRNLNSTDHMCITVHYCFKRDRYMVTTGSNI